MREVPFVRSADKLALATNATGYLAQSSSASRVTAPHKPGAPASRASLPMHRPYSAGNGHFLDGRFERHTASTRIVLVMTGRPVTGRKAVMASPGPPIRALPDLCLGIISERLG